MNIFKFKYKRFKHKLTARHSYGFGVHSPFLFSFTKFIIYEKNPFYVFSDIEALARKMRGARKMKALNDSDSIAQVNFELSSKMKRNRQLLFRIVRELKPHSVLEVGSSFGLSTIYLAAGDPQGFCSSIVSTTEAAENVKRNSSVLKLDNIKVLNADLKSSLNQFTQENKSIDLIFINPSVPVDSILHCFEHCLPFINNNSVFICSNIHRSAESEEVWKTMTMHKKTTAFLDLFSFGFLFFRKDLVKKRYKMRF